MSKFFKGKILPDAVYAHKDYTDIFPKEEYDKALNILKAKQPEFEFTYVKYNKATICFTFTFSPDWDTSNEPTVGDSWMVKPDGSIKFKLALKDPYIIHGKHFFVDTNYNGFEYEKAELRRAQYEGKDWIDKSRMGRLSWWQEHAIPKIGK